MLVRLPPATQADILHRLVELEETDPEILREVERGLEQRLSELVRMQRRRVAGLSAVRGILDSSEQQVGMQLLRNLARHDRPLADRIHPGRFEFSDLLSMDRRARRASSRRPTSNCYRWRWLVRRRTGSRGFWASCLNRRRGKCGNSWSLPARPV